MSFQVSVSTLTLGSLYEAVLAFSSQESLETFWPSVCVNARWFIPSKRLGIVMSASDAGCEVVGMFEQGKFRSPKESRFDAEPGELRRALSLPTAHWMAEPWRTLEESRDDFARWLVHDRPEMLFVVPLRVKGRNVGAMLFATGRMEEADQAMLNTLGTIYALHVGMTYTLFRVSEERRQIENLLVMQEKMASLGGLVAGILHEINSPLGAARAANDTTARCLVKMEEMGGDAFRTMIDIVKGNTAVIGAGADRIGALVASLKNFARPDEAEYQLVSLHEGIESTLTVMAGELQERIALIKEFGEIPKITCIAGQLNQVFMGILRNAVEAIEGNGTIRIETFEAQDGVHVRISDTGRGIGPAKLKRIFEFDFSGRGSRVKMGAGLATAYQIVQRHGGLIEVKSELGSGSTFEVILPLRLDKRVTGGEATLLR